MGDCSNFMLFDDSAVVFLISYSLLLQYLNYGHIMNSAICLLKFLYHEWFEIETGRPYACCFTILITLNKSKFQAT